MRIVFDSPGERDDLISGLVLAICPHTAGLEDCEHVCTMQQKRGCDAELCEVCWKVALEKIAEVRDL